MRIFNLIDFESSLKEDYVFDSIDCKIQALIIDDPLNSLIAGRFWRRDGLESSLRIRALKGEKLI